MYSIKTKPIQDDIPKKYRYLFITKDYPKPTPPEGKKKCTKEQLERYNDTLAKRKEMFNMLDSGTYDVGNSEIELDSFTSFLTFHYKETDDYLIYKINPIHSRKTSESWNSRERYCVSKFTVEKKITGIYEFIDDLADEEACYIELFRYFFDQGHYSNAGYRQQAIELFEYFAKKYPDKSIYLEDLIRRDNTWGSGSRYEKNSKMEEYVRELFDNNLIKLINDKSYELTYYIRNLITSNWFYIAKVCLKSLESLKSLNNTIAWTGVKWLAEDKDVLKVLRENSDKEIVKEISSMLGIKDNGIVLNVYSYMDWDDDKLIESKTFKDMDEVRTYVIQKYKIPFEKASKDVNYWRLEDDDTFFKLNE